MHGSGFVRFVTYLVGSHTPKGVPQDITLTTGMPLGSWGPVSGIQPSVCMQVTTGAAEKYQDLRIILAHAGGFVPYVASRIGMAATAIAAGGLADAGVSDTAIALLKRFYVDTALSSEETYPVSYSDMQGPHCACAFAGGYLSNPALTMRAFCASWSVPQTFKNDLWLERPLLQLH